MTSLSLALSGGVWNILDDDDGSLPASLTTVVMGGVSSTDLVGMVMGCASGTMNGAALDEEKDVAGVTRGMLVG